MKKLLVIVADQKEKGAADGPHTFKKEHEEKLRAAGGGALEVAIATPEEAVVHYADAEAVASFPLRMPEIGKLPGAKWLHSFSAGVDRILTPEVAKSDVILSNSRGVHATPIAEHIIGFMLMFSRGFQTTFENQQKHLWQKAQVLGELRDSRVLIVGMGEIGTEAARLANAFGAHVRAIVRTKRDAPEFVEKLATSEELDTELKEADFVVITLPHTNETHYLFNAKKFALMNKSAVIINIGRGGIINEKDLVDALSSGTISGAGLDVTETEPLPKESPLWDMPQVVITPHHSGLSHCYMDRAVGVLCKNIEAYMRGEKLLTQVDKKLGY